MMKQKRYGRLNTFLYLLMAFAVLMTTSLAGAAESAAVRVVDPVNEPDNFSAVLYDNTNGLPTAAANAGHEYPAIMQPGGKFELLMDKHGIVLGGMSGISYKEYEVHLEPGAKLFVYTDGVPEATDANEEMFGNDRMVDALNTDPSAPPEKILENVRTAVNEFVKDAEQFDDLTMLCLEYHTSRKDVE